MLVKKSIVEKWYQRDSWVYKNFAYLFSNPLWNKSIPSGFSVCPYFWLSLFSLLIFRPLFLFPIKYGIQPILHFLGKPATAIDNWLLNIAEKCGFECPMREQFHGLGFVIGSMTMLLVFGIGMFVTIFGKSAIDLYHEIGDIKEGLFAFWSGLSFIIMYLVIGIHKMFTNSKCQTHNYLWVWLSLFIIAVAIIVPNEFLLEIKAFGYMFWSVIVDFCSIVFYGLFTSIAYIWSHVIVVVLKWTLNLITFAPIPSLYVPWWTYLLLLSCFGWLADRILNNTTENYASQSSYLERNRKAWIDLFTRVLMTDTWFTKHFQTKIKDIFRKHERSYYEYSAMETNKIMIYNAALELMLKSELDKLQAQYPNKNIDWRLLRNLNDVNLAFYTIGVSDVYVSKIDTYIILACDRPEIKQMIEDQAHFLKEVERQREEHVILMENSWSHRMCIKVTEAIGNIVTNSYSGIVKGSTRLWNLIKMGYTQIATFFGYMWMLAKAKKQGVCPYFRFTDPSQPNKTP